MANLKAAVAALRKKQADLDMMDDQLSAMPEMAPDMAPDADSDMGSDMLDTPTSPEFDLLSEKREELESEIRQMREGVRLLTEWEKFKGGQWSEEIKGMLNEIDIEITDIAGGEQAPAGDLIGGAPAPDMAPAPDLGAPAPDMAPAPEAPLPPAPAADIPVEPEMAPEVAPEPAIEEPAAPPMAPMASAKSLVGKKNSYQAPLKKGISAPSNLKKDGSTMANQTTSKPNLKEKLAEVKSKREAIKKEAQQRVAAAWTIAKTMLPDAPAELQKSAAATLLQNPTPVLNAMLRQTAKNAHASKLAETFKQVHKVELNDLLEDPSVLNSEKKAVESEIKGDAKSAAAKTADDRKDSGPQPEKYDDGRDGSEPKGMDAGKAAERPANTVNKSEGGDKVASKAAAAEEPKAEKAAAEKCSKCGDGECKCAAKEKSAAKNCAKCGIGKECKCATADEKKDDKKEAAVAKKADESAIMDAPPAEAPAMDAPPADMPPAEEGLEAPPEEMPPADEAPAEDSAAEVLTDEKKMLVEEKIEEAQEAISALEQEILQESTEGEELDYSQIFNEGDMEEKAAALANEGDEHTAGNGEEFFAPSAAENLEASLDGTQMASMEDFFSLKGSDSDPLAHLIAGEVKSAAEVAGMDVIPSSTGEAANEFESESAKGEARDNESDHEGDLFAEAIESVSPEEGGFKRVKQDETNEMQEPKAAAKKAVPVIKKLKPVIASEKKPFDIASALFGNDEV